MPGVVCAHHDFYTIVQPCLEALLSSSGGSLKLSTRYSAQRPYADSCMPYVTTYPLSIPTVAAENHYSCPPCLCCNDYVIIPHHRCRLPPRECHAPPLPLGAKA